jgi:hypothetical protein
MRVLTRATAAELILAQGVSPVRVEEALSGFDFAKPVYEQDFWPEDVLFQLVRLPSVRDPVPASGNWYGLAGITARGVAVNDGLAGRRLNAYKVVSPFKALEGTAVKFKVDRGSGIGGDGGATQVFIPSALLGHLQSLGPADR